MKYGLINIINIKYFVLYLNLLLFIKVKRRLDYQLELANLTRTVQQRHMVNWIIENVLKSLTSEQEKQSFKKCMLDLQALAAKA